MAGFDCFNTLQISDIHIGHLVMSSLRRGQIEIVKKRKENAERKNNVNYTNIPLFYTTLFFSLLKNKV